MLKKNYKHSSCVYIYSLVTLEKVFGTATASVLASSMFAKICSPTRLQLENMPETLTICIVEDNPSTILVTQLFMDETITTPKSRSFLMVVTTKNKICYVDGTILQPLDSLSLVFNAWRHYNTMLLSWSFNSLSKEFMFHRKT